MKRANATLGKQKTANYGTKFLSCDSYPIPLRRVMSTEMVLQVVWSSTLAVDSVASLTIPMYPKTDPQERLTKGHLTHNISHQLCNKTMFLSKNERLKASKQSIPVNKKHYTLI